MRESTKYNGLVVLSCFCLMVSGCDKAKEFETYEAPPVPEAIEVMVVGNSITLHPPSVEIDWKNNNGMAASEKSKDYAHIVVSGLGVGVEKSYIRNFYPFETDSSIAQSHVASLENALSKKPRIIILQLGDNVRVVKSEPVSSFFQLLNFWFDYGRLVEESKRNTGSLYCVSTWWESTLKDYIIKSRCESSGGAYVYIGDIYPDPANPDRAKVDYSVSGVDAHPKDYGMRKIAERITSAISAGR